MGSMDSFPLHYLMLKSYQPRWEKGELRSLWRLLLTPMDWLRWSGRRSRFFILILPASFIFNLMPMNWLPFLGSSSIFLSGKKWLPGFVNISIVFCKIKRLTDRIVSNTLTFAIMANPRCENGSKIPTSPKCSTPRAVPWHQVTRLGLTVDNYLQLPKQIWLHCTMTVLAWLPGVSVSPVFNLQKANARTPFTM